MTKDNARRIALDLAISVLGEFTQCHDFDQHPFLDGVAQADRDKIAGELDNIIGGLCVKRRRAGEQTA